MYIFYQDDGEREADSNEFVSSFSSRKPNDKSTLVLSLNESEITFEKR